MSAETVNPAFGLQRLPAARRPGASIVEGAGLRAVGGVSFDLGLRPLVSTESLRNGMSFQKDALF